MAPLRRNTHEPPTTVQNPLRIIAVGTLFVTHTLSLPSHPAPSTAVRAHAVARTRGGSASVVSSLLAQFPAVDAMLVAPLGAKDEGATILRELEQENVSTKYCKIWPDAGVPSAWVMHSAETDTRAVINHNPLPDVTHEEFVSLLGPLLAPENYANPTPSPSPAVPSPSAPSSSGQAPPSPSPAPFDWLHFEGRSVKTTLNNIYGVDGLARERQWRNHCVFSVARADRLIPHADVLFVNQHYAQSQSPHYATTPRAFLLSLASVAPPHALLVAHWGAEGAAVLSLPTREYFQSSGWVDERRERAPSLRTDATESVRSGSDFWAGGRSQTPSSSAFTAAGGGNVSSGRHGDDSDSQGTETPEHAEDEVLDEVGAQDAFVAGMIYALSRKILPGAPYIPLAQGKLPEPERGRWRLDECLRFATELSGRKARRRNWNGLADEMMSAGWFGE
ncbi:hypothetical protein PLICRDRAFT_174809 [Plicaturopsis crispa FD-325 SS-3]|nr:hypothetical protein PLICRDRAFT_174809 [Plicaturopsis crispa FD-325 SS-3]